ncbi:MAG: hypothetical protein JNK85_23985 [Verrucomicrobiales bacterium]|nr:hypothetical protein [Verrucomicrobiales bacterium]
MKLRIPLDTLRALLGRPITSGSQVRLGLFRAEFYGREAGTRGEATDNWLSWVRPASAQPDFHLPSAFRRMHLPSEQARCRVAESLVGSPLR